MSNADLLFCREVYEQLRDLIDKGLGDSEEADEIRDSAEEPWYNMTEDERNSFRERIKNEISISR